jgi:uncharacterized protein
VKTHKKTWFKPGILGIALALSFSAQGAELTAEQIMERNYLVSRFPGASFEASFQLVSSDGATRMRRTVGQSKLKDGSSDMKRVTRFVEPADVRGTSTLVVEQAGRDDDIWVYLPALHKVRRLVASNKKDSFLGTDFSYADVVGYRPKDWSYRLIGDSSQDGQSCYVVEGTPRSDVIRAQSGYSKRVDCVGKDNLVTLRSEMWDEANQPLKKAFFREIQQPDAKLNRWQPMLMEAQNLQTRHRTVIRFAKFKVSSTISDDVFSPQSLDAE